MAGTNAQACDAACTSRTLRLLALTMRRALATTATRQPGFSPSPDGHQASGLLAIIVERKAKAVCPGPIAREGGAEQITEKVGLYVTHEHRAHEEQKDGRPHRDRSTIGRCVASSKVARTRRDESRTYCTCVRLARMESVIRLWLAL